MSTASDMGPDKQTLVQFHRYVDLPAELRIKVIQEFIMDLREEHRFRYQLGRPQFARFAVIHSEWQHEFEAEQELFGGLCLSTDDLPAYRAILNQHRRDSLSKLTLRVYIDNTAVGFNRQIDHRSGRAGVVSRAGALIVNSMATILESVEDSIQNGSQAARAGLEIQTQIMIPGFGVDGDDDHRRLRGILSSNRGIDCDFSQLPVLHTARKFSQPILTHSQVLAMGHPMLLFLNPLSLLSLVRRMPNLEQATAGIAPGASLTLGHISAQQMNPCPRLKTLRVQLTGFSFVSWDTLADWTSCWGNTIENLQTCQTQAPAFLRRFIKREDHSEAIAWPNLQVLKVQGYCVAMPVPTLADVVTASGGPMETLCAMAVALAWLPSIKDMTIGLGLILGNNDYFEIVIKLRLHHGSSKLTIPQPIRTGSRPGAFTDAFWSGSSESGELSFKDQMHDAAAEVQAAVKMHRGHDLKIVWSETVEEGQSQ